MDLHSSSPRSAGPGRAAAPTAALLLLALCAALPPGCRRGRPPAADAAPDGAPSATPPAAAPSTVNGTPTAPAAQADAPSGAPAALVVDGQAAVAPEGVVASCSGACRVARSADRPADDGTGDAGTRLFIGDALETPPGVVAVLDLPASQITILGGSRVSFGPRQGDDVCLHRGALVVQSLGGPPATVNLRTTAGTIAARGIDLAAAAASPGRLLVMTPTDAVLGDAAFADGFDERPIARGATVEIDADGRMAEPAGEPYSWDNQKELTLAGYRDFPVRDRLRTWLAGTNPADATAWSAQLGVLRAVVERLQPTLPRLADDVDALRARSRELLSRTDPETAGELSPNAARSLAADHRLAALWYRVFLLLEETARAAESTGGGRPEWLEAAVTSLLELEPRMEGLLRRVPRSPVRASAP